MYYFHWYLIPNYKPNIKNSCMILIIYHLNIILQITFDGSNIKTKIPTTKLGLFASCSILTKKLKE